MSTQTNDKPIHWAWLIPISILLGLLIYWSLNRENEKKPIEERDSRNMLIVKTIGLVILSLIAMTVSSKIRKSKTNLMKQISDGKQIFDDSTNSAMSSVNSGIDSVNSTIHSYQKIKANIAYWFVVVICVLFGIFAVLLISKGHVEIGLIMIAVLLFCFFIAHKNKKLMYENKGYATVTGATDLINNISNKI
jgi:hypothetical protein